MQFFLIRVLGFLICLSFSLPNAMATDPKDCEDLLSPTTVLVDETQILKEEHSLFELLKKDPAQNLAIQHPSIVMNAWQRTLSWILSTGVRTEPHPEYGTGNINVYPIFSDGLPEAGGKRIIDQHDAIQVLADYLIAGARGDGSRSKMLIFNGPPGTGKSEFLTILANIAENLTANRPEHFMYVYEWHGLKNVPELQPVLNLQTDAQGNQFEHPLPCPLNESPFALLPEGYQNQVLEVAKTSAMKIAKAEPNPPRKLCPHCMKVREALLKHHMAEHNMKSMTPEQVVKLLDRHVRIKRVVVGKSGSLPKINAEGKDVDYSGLFGSPNAFLLNTFGTRHPFSYSLDGKILRANGQMLMLDEFFRNVPELRDTFLEVIENGEVVRGGAPKVHLDTVIIGASNDESIDNAKANSASKAHLDRVRLIPMRYSVAPHSVAKTMLLMKNPHTFIQQELAPRTEETEAPKPVRVNLDQLFPKVARGQPLQGPDRRYNLWVAGAAGSQPLHISPHTLMYIATTVAATRINTSPADAMKFLPNSKAINTAAFQDHVTRMKILTRELNIPAAEADELQELSRYLKEGTFGISTRDAANVWLTQAIAEAQKPENGHCLTPQLAMKVYLKLLADGAIQYPDNKTRLRWISISEAMMKHFLIPNIQQDVQMAVGSGLGAVNSVYDEVFNELLALQADNSAKVYQTETNESRPINFDRLKEIEAIYQITERRAFSHGELIAFHAARGMKSGDHRHQGLVRATNSYLAKRVTDLIAFDDLARFAQANEGTTEVRAKFSDLSHLMRHELGYCPHCMKAAMTLAKQASSGKAQQPTEK